MGCENKRSNLNKWQKKEQKKQLKILQFQSGQNLNGSKRYNNTEFLTNTGGS
jgi:hypothetical protein